MSDNLSTNIISSRISTTTNYHIQFKMSDLKVEATEPDPSATSLPNDQTVKTEVADSSEPTVKDTDMADSKPANGEAAVKEESADKNGENGAESKKDTRRYDENGVLKTNAKQDWKDPKKNSKYDPSILPNTDDPAKIRAQVHRRITLVASPTC